MIKQETVFSAPDAGTLFSHSSRVPVFFDIETTSLSPKTGLVYLIGCALPLPKTGKWQLTQWFAETPQEEDALLCAFFSFLPKDCLLCHYNGAVFDLPFLNARARHYGREEFPDASDTLDYYRLLSPIKKLFALPSRRQKQLEALLGICREDRLDGKELISHYTEYIGRARFDKERADELLSLLLLHNREDVQGLVQIAALDAVCLLMQGEYADETCALTENELQITLTLLKPLPCTLNQSLEGSAYGDAIHLFAKETQAILRISLVRRTLFYYYDNYRDYFYLPDEDICIYHSLAESVPKARRVRCTKETARCKKEGCFFMQPKPIFVPAFRTAPDAAVCYAQIQQLTRQPEHVREYVQSIFSYCALSNSKPLNIGLPSPQNVK